MLPAPFDILPETAYRVLNLDAGETLFRQGDRSRGIFYLITGSVRLLRFARGGETVVIHRAGPLETFAEASLFVDVYHCDAILEQAAQLVELRREPLLRQFHSDPLFAMALTSRFATQVQTYRRRLELLAVRSAQERVFAALSEGFLTGDIKTFATEIGLSHEATYRALSHLARCGRLVKTGRGKYRVKTT